MTTTSISGRCRAIRNGFTLIELMIVLVVIGILAAIAYPSFIATMARSDRNDARAALLNVQMAQERFRATSGAYTDDFDDLAGASNTSENNWYSLAISEVSRSGYLVTATAVAGQRQAVRDDPECHVIALRVYSGGQERLGSAALEPGLCW